MADGAVRTSARRRKRLARGPLTIGEPAPQIDVRLADPNPYRPDTIADGGSIFGLTVRAASVRGLYKRYLGGARQDDVCLRIHQQTSTVVAAVADGVSSAPRSDLAAALAVRHAAAAVMRQLDRAGPEALDWAKVFEQAAWSLVEEHRRAADDQSAGVEEAAASLATTMVVAAVTDAVEEGAERADSPSAQVRLAAVGDSPALALEGSEFRALLDSETDGEELLGGGVDALPRITSVSQQASYELRRGSVLLLCTDGVALPLAGGDGEVGQALARELARPPDVIDFARLVDFSRSTYDDDRTLVAIWRSEGQ